MLCGTPSRPNYCRMSIIIGYQKLNFNKALLLLLLLDLLVDVIFYYRYVNKIWRDILGGKL